MHITHLETRWVGVTLSTTRTMEVLRVWMAVRGENNGGTVESDGAMILMLEAAMVVEGGRDCFLAGVAPCAALLPDHPVSENVCAEKNILTEAGKVETSARND